MKFNSQDQQDYQDYLKSKIAEQNAQEDSIAKFYNLTNLQKDLNSFANRKVLFRKQ